MACDEGSVVSGIVLSVAVSVFITTSIYVWELGFFSSCCNRLGVPTVLVVLGSHGGFATPTSDQWRG